MEKRSWMETQKVQGENLERVSNDVWCRDMGSVDSREEVGCSGNEDVKMDEWSNQAGQN